MQVYPVYTIELIYTMKHTHTLTHTCTHAHMHARTQAHTYTHMKFWIYYSFEYTTGNNDNGSKWLL